MFLRHFYFYFNQFYLGQPFINYISEACSYNQQINHSIITYILLMYNLHSQNNPFLQNKIYHLSYGIIKMLIQNYNMGQEEINQLLMRFSEPYKQEIQNIFQIVQHSTLNQQHTFDRDVGFTSIQSIDLLICDILRYICLEDKDRQFIFQQVYHFCRKYEIVLPNIIQFYVKILPKMNLSQRQTNIHSKTYILGTLILSAQLGSKFQFSKSQIETIFDYVISHFIYKTDQIIQATQSPLKFLSNLNNPQLMSNQIEALCTKISMANQEFSQYIFKQAIMVLKKTIKMKKTQQDYKCSEENNTILQNYSTQVQVICCLRLLISIHQTAIFVSHSEQVIQFIIQNISYFNMKANNLEDIHFIKFMINYRPVEVLNVVIKVDDKLVTLCYLQSYKPICCFKSPYINIFEELVIETIKGIPYDNIQMLNTLMNYQSITMNPYFLGIFLQQITNYISCSFLNKSYIEHFIELLTTLFRSTKYNQIDKYQDQENTFSMVILCKVFYPLKNRLKFTNFEEIMIKISIIILDRLRTNSGEVIKVIISFTDQILSKWLQLRQYELFYVFFIMLIRKQIINNQHCAIQNILNQICNCITIYKHQIQFLACILYLRGQSYPRQLIKSIIMKQCSNQNQSIQWFIELNETLSQFQQHNNGFCFQLNYNGTYKDMIKVRWLWLYDQFDNQNLKQNKIIFTNRAIDRILNPSISIQNIKYRKVDEIIPILIELKKNPKIKNTFYNIENLLNQFQRVEFNRFVCTFKRKIQQSQNNIIVNLQINHHQPRKIYKIRKLNQI